MSRILGTLVFLSLSTPLGARELYVNPQTGDDTRDGTSAVVSGATGPVRTIARGVKLAQPGDTLHLANTGQAYRESIVFHNRHGEVGRPITVDGHDATIEGCEPLAIAEWEPVAPGRFRKTKL
ncbi:MAG: hypothetical protein JNM18_20165, partial [Planctomycetaceae bacterium]|nr:hypothetical protein [Planctomycetaceae bacterium]